MEVRLVLLFEVADHVCALAAGALGEIVFLPALTRLPGQPAVIEGFLNLRGTAVPVVRLNRLFDLADCPAQIYSPLIIVHETNGALALLVDHAVDVAQVAAADLQPIPENHSFNDCAVAQFRFGERQAALLDAHRVLLEKERQCIAELRAKAQAQLDALPAPAA